jgi:hypothetical protein
MNTTSLEGGCLCGAVRYRIDAAPLATSRCHCRSCRLATGAPSVAWAVMPANAFVYLRGQPTQHRSSPQIVRTFCSHCGTSLTWQHDEQPQSIDITTATLDDPDALAPSREIWLDQKIAWQPLDAALPHYPGSSRDTKAISY